MQVNVSTRVNWSERQGYPPTLHPTSRGLVLCRTPFQASHVSTLCPHCSALTLLMTSLTSQPAVFAPAARPPQPMGSCPQGELTALLVSFCSCSGYNNLYESLKRCSAWRENHGLAELPDAMIQIIQCRKLLIGNRPQILQNGRLEASFGVQRLQRLAEQ